MFGNEDTKDKGFQPRWTGPGSENLAQSKELEVKRFYVENKLNEILSKSKELEKQRSFLIDMLKDIYAETEGGNPNFDLQKSQKLYLEIKKRLDEIRKKEEELAQEIISLAQREKIESFILDQSISRRDFDG